MNLFHILFLVAIPALIVNGMPYLGSLIGDDTSDQSKDQDKPVYVMNGVTLIIFNGNGTNMNLSQTLDLKGLDKLAESLSNVFTKTPNDQLITEQPIITEHVPSTQVTSTTTGTNSIEQASDSTETSTTF